MRFNFGDIPDTKELSPLTTQKVKVALLTQQHDDDGKFDGWFFKV